MLTCLKYGSAENYFNNFMILAIIIAFNRMRDWQPLQVFLVLAYLFVFASVKALRYIPRSVHFTISEDYRGKLDRADEAIMEELDDSETVYTNIRPIILKRDEHVIFPQFEIVECSMDPGDPSRDFYMDVMNSIDYENMKLVILERNSGHIPIDLEEYTLIDQIEDVDIYVRKDSR